MALLYCQWVLIAQYDEPTLTSTIYSSLLKSSASAGDAQSAISKGMHSNLLVTEILKF